MDYDFKKFFDISCIAEFYCEESLSIVQKKGTIFFNMTP
jgi:hypothetical protein